MDKRETPTRLTEFHRPDRTDDLMEKQPVQEVSGWVQNLRPAPAAELRLVCCPHAGASATTFGPFAGTLPDQIEALAIEYPGRRGGPDHQGFSDIGTLAADVCHALRPWRDRPLAVFGHSMGSVVAFEVARRLEIEGTRAVRLFVSGRRSPSDGLGVTVPRDDQEIVDELRTLGGIPGKLLDKPKFRQSVLTVVRSDYRANSAYLAPRDAVVRCPITFLLSDADPYVDVAAARAWRRHTTGEFHLRSFPGGHFFLREQLSQVVEAVTADLWPALAAPRPSAAGRFEHGQQSD
jgi:surfactin synthase thioesterase subunit